MSMSLVDVHLSPYTTRNRIQIRAKGLEKEIAFRDRLPIEEYKLIAPTGRVPCLDTGHGFHLVESETIAEFIEDVYPVPSLRGKDSLDRAKVRLFSRLLDIYYLAGLNILFGQFAANPRDPAKVEEGIAKIDEGLRLIAHYLPDGATYAVEDRLTLADCALAPALFYAKVMPSAFGQTQFLGHDKVKAYYERVTAADPHIKRAVEEMSVALNEFLKQRAA